MNVSKRLAWCLTKGNLTVADLARWLERPDPTVRGWVRGGAMGGAPGDVSDVLASLGNLEKQIKAGKALPVPRMSARQRRGYLDEAKIQASKNAK